MSAYFGSLSMRPTATAQASAGSPHDGVVTEMLGSLQVQLSNHHRGLLLSARTFLPEIVVNAINSNELEEDQTIVSKCEGAVVFSDASGFTALTERLALYSNGAELLSKCLNKFFNPLIDLITAYRGDVIKFSGDALTILFAATNDDRDFVHACGSPSCAHEPLELACLRASACCIEIHKRLHNFDTGEGDVRLTLHIGVGAGPVTILQVGGNQNRYEYVIAGQPLAQIAIAEPLASSGETVLSPQCWEYVEYTVVEGPPIESNPDYHRLHALDITKHTYPTIKQAAQQSYISNAHQDEDLDGDELERRLRASSRFIPRSVMKQLRTGSLRGINEMRTVSIIFVQIGGVDVSTDPGSRTAKQLMNGMQLVAYSEEGSLNKFLVDDKGLLFLFVFGLPPLVHVDDPTRATRASLDMSTLLMEMNLTGRIGITTGRVYCGVVGSDTRKEYTVMGDTVNLSARLMANAEANTVLVDETTYKRCRKEFSFLKMAPIKVKGKESMIVTYRPVKPSPVSLDDTAEIPIEPLSSPTSKTQVVEMVHKLPGLRHVLQARCNAQGRDVRIPLPWAPKSTVFKGRSPLPEVQVWRPLVRAQELVAQRLQNGGGAIMIIGDPGCGKEELGEVLIKKCVEVDGMMPVFGTMQMRVTEQWAAPFELICGLLSILHKRSGEVEVTNMTWPMLERLARLEDVTDSEMRAMRRIGPAYTATVRSQATLESLVTEHTTTSAHKSKAAAAAPPPQFALEEDSIEKVICSLARKLLQKLITTERVVLTLRCWQGTSLSPCETHVFWLLVKEMAELATAQPPGQLLVLVLTRMGPWEAMPSPVAEAPTDRISIKRHQTAKQVHIPTDMYDTVEFGPMTDIEAKVFIGAILGIDDEISPSCGVPDCLFAWLSGITLNVPRNIQETLVQLREEEKVKVWSGRVIVTSDLDTIDIAAWVHTGMVGSIISKIEMMGAEAQRIIKMATVFDGAFSALDVAAANRMHRPASDILAYYDSVHLLMSCEWLVTQNFLKRDNYERNEHTADGQTWRLPRWSIANLLIRKVVGATLLHSQKMQIKRAALIARRLNIDLPQRMKAKMALREQLFGKTSKAEKIRQQRRKEQSTSQWESPSQAALQFGSESTFSGLPSSCIVLPLTAAAEMGIPIPVAGCNFASEHWPSVSPGCKTCSINGHGDSAQADVDRMSDWLNLMSSSGHTGRVMQLLKNGAPAAATDPASLTPLHFACLSGELEIVRALVQSRADVHSVAPDHGSPLDVAVAHGHLDIVEYLADGLGLLSSKSDQYWQNMLSQLESSDVPRAPVPTLVHDMVAWNKIEEANYRRSQTLLFVQDCITLGDDDRPDNSAGGQNKAALANKGEVSTGPTSCLKDLAGSKVRKFVISLFVIMALLGPDMWVLTDGSQKSLDNWLTIGICLFVLDMALNLAVDPGYKRDLVFATDFVGTVALIFEISWMLGPNWHEDYMTPETPLDGRKGSYSLPLARTARSGDLLVRMGRYSTVFARIINTCFACCLGKSAGDTDFGGVDKFRRQLLRTITMHVAIYTVLLVISMPVMDYMLLPNADLSMQAWAQILASYMPDGVAIGQQARNELNAFGEFYEKLWYGPFRVCAGSQDAHGNFRCEANGTIWDPVDAPVDLSFAEPSVAASRLDMQWNQLQLSFDFTQARQVEAEMHIGVMALAIVLMIVTTLFISRAVSDLVLRPLQRMLSSAKEVAKPIFGEHGTFGMVSLEDNLDEEHMQDEVYVLERTVEKLGKIAGIAANITASLEDSLEGLEGEDRGVVQMMFQKEENKPKKQERNSATSTTHNLHYSEINPTPGKEMQSRLQALLVSWEQLDSWELNLFNMEVSKQTGIVGWILLQNTTTFGDIQLAPETTAKFLQTLASNYRAENAFHNWSHAVDVQHTLWRMILISEAHTFLTGLNQFALLVSAIGHDVGHFGLNNQFLIETSHELTVRYNDRSPLENMHCAKLFEIVSGQPGVNIFEPLAKPQFFEIRRICVETILHTDMVHHFEMVKETQMLYQMNSDVYEEDLIALFRERDTKSKVMNLFVHSADVSNPCKPWKITYEWAMRCLAEFFDQGDKEKEMGIPVQMLNDRAKVNKPFSQIGFVEFMIAPLEAAKTMLFPALCETTEFLENNIAQWKRLWVEENNPADEEREKVRARVSKVCKTLSDARHVHYRQDQDRNWKHSCSIERASDYSYRSHSEFNSEFGPPREETRTNSAASDTNAPP